MHWPFPSVTYIYLHILNTPSSVPSLNMHTHVHTHILIHNADFSFCPVNAAQLGSAQQQQNSALCSFLPPLLVLLNSAAYTLAHAHTHTHTLLSHPLHVFFASKSLSFLLLIMVVEPFELFKAVRTARKTPSAPKRDDLSAEREREKKSGRKIRFC